MADRVSTEPDMGIQTPCADEQDWLHVTLASIGDAVLACDVHGRITYLNPMAVSLTGWKLREAQGLPVQDVFRIINEETGAPADNIVARVLKNGRRTELANHTALITKDGRAIPIEDSAAPIHNTAGSVVGVVLVFHDVTERKQQEKELQQVNRTLRALTKVSKAMLHATNEATLLRQVCEIINKDCGYAMVWTGFAEKDAGKTVRPIAHAGIEDSYLKTVRITWAEDSESGRGPAGIAIRTRKPYCCRNISTDREFAPWRAEAKKRGYESVLVLPLADGDKVFGALVIYSNQANSFPDEERTLLEELSAHLAYGINALRVRAAHDAAEAVLRESEAQLRFALKANRAGMWMVDLVSGSREVSPELQQLYGLRPGEFDGTQESSTGPIIPEDRAQIAVAMQAAMHSGEFEADFRYKSAGSDAIRWMQGRGLVIRDAHDRPLRMIGVNTDITERKQAEEKLRHSEERFSKAFVASPDALLITRLADGLVREVNGSYTKLYGYTRDEVVGKLSTKLGIYLDDDTRRRGVEAFEKQGHLRDYEMLIRTQAGEIRTTLCTAEPIQIAGEPHMLTIIRDITERKQHEAERDRLDRQKQLALDAAELGWWHYDPITNISRFDDRYREIFEVLGDESPNDEILTRLNSGDLPAVWANVEAALDPVNPKPYSAAYRINMPDGSQKWIEAHGIATFEGEGHDRRAASLVGTVQDITERKRYEARLRRFFETDLFAILYWKIDGGVIDVNDKFLEMTGYTREDLQAGRINWAEITPPEYQAMDDDARRQILETGVHQPYEKEYVRKDGRRVWGLFAAAAWEDNRREGVSFILDISERKQAENALLRSEKLASVGRMAATIAHEINNPLAAVTNSLFLAKNMDTMSAAREYLDIADEELRRIAHITRQSLGFYRESNAPALTSINAVLDSTLELLKNKIKAKHAVIEKQWGGELSINAVAGELRQVFSNFVANSLDAIESHGIIRLRLSIHTAVHDGRRCVRLTIADNGKGISASSLSHIFEPFYTTKGTVGTGLGLWVSKQIVDKHAGKIRVRSSTREGQSGTVICVMLPFEAEEAPQNQSAHA